MFFHLTGGGIWMDLLLENAKSLRDSITKN